MTATLDSSYAPADDVQSSARDKGDTNAANIAAQTYSDSSYSSTFRDSYQDSARQSRDMSQGPNAILGDLQITSNSAPKNSDRTEGLTYGPTTESGLHGSSPAGADANGQTTQIDGAMHSSNHSMPISENDRLTAGPHGPDTSLVAPDQSEPALQDGATQNPNAQPGPSSDFQPGPSSDFQPGSSSDFQQGTSSDFQPAQILEPQLTAPPVASEGAQPNRVSPRESSGEQEVGDDKPERIQDPLVFETNKRELNDMLNKVFEGPEWNNQTGSEKEQVQNRARLLGEAVNNYLPKLGLPPVDLKASEESSRSLGYYDDGKLAIHPKVLLNGGETLVNTLAHELTHHEQRTLMVLAAEQNVNNGQASFADHLSLKGLDTFLSSAKAARGGQPLSNEEWSRGNKLLEEEFTRSGEFKENDQLRETASVAKGYSKLLNDSNPEHFTAYKLMNRFSRDYGKDPVEDKLLSHPSMQDFRSKMQFEPDGSLKKWDLDTEVLHKKEMKTVMDKISENLTDRFRSKGDLFQRYEGWLWEREARQAGESVAAEHQKPIELRRNQYMQTYLNNFTNK